MILAWVWAFKVTVKDSKIKELQGTHALFDRLLYLAVLDLHLVFTYPLTHASLSLLHLNGT